MFVDPSAEATPPQHIAIIGALRRDRAECLSRLPASVALPPPLLPTISAHRRLRGPYTAAGTLLRAIVPGALATRPDLVAAHQVEILSVAPELRATVPSTMETLTSLAVPEERTRFYSRLRTLRIAHGLIEFVRDLLLAEGDGPRSIVLEDLDHADPTDQEFVAVLLRRIGPGLLTVVCCGTPSLLDPPAVTDAVAEGTPVTESLPAALVRFSRRVDASPVAFPAVELGSVELATRYVAGDCTSDMPAELAAYDDLPVARRQILHDRRAAELATTEEHSYDWGAIPFHLEHGTDRLGRGAVAMVAALDECMLLGFYDATIDLCLRGRKFISWAEHPLLRWMFTSKLPTSFSAHGRTRDAEAICIEAMANSAEPGIHELCAYAMSMVHTRYQERRDHELALASINRAIAIASLLPAGKRRAFSTVFNHNGLALIEVHRGRPERALELVTEGIAELDKALGADEQQLHRSVLRHNRAQVLAGLGRLDEALGDYRAVIDADPHYPEYHFELAGLLAKMGRAAEAFGEYATAMRLGPPFPELYYNRGDLRLGTDDTDGALVDFDYVLELDPDFVDAYVNRAGVYLELGDLDAAERDAVAGLAREPDNAHLHAVLGRVRTERGDDTGALSSFDRALYLKADLVPALSGRATLAYQMGDCETAVADLTRAIELDSYDPVLRYNRALVRRDAAQWSDALADLDAAAKLAPEDEDIQLARQECHEKLTLR